MSGGVFLCTAKINSVRQFTPQEESRGAFVFRNKKLTN
jgi:hypothetical protein